MTSQCAVLGCISGKEFFDGKELFPFPNSTSERLKWIEFTGREDDWIPPVCARICERHFVDGKPTKSNPLPTLELPKKAFESPPPKRKLQKPSTNKILSKGISIQFCYDAPDEKICVEKSVPLPGLTVITSKRKVEAPQINQLAAEITIDDTTEAKLDRIRMATSDGRCRKRWKNATHAASIDSGLKKWVSDQLEKSVITSASLKSTAKEIAAKNRIVLNDEFDDWLDEWRLRNNVALDDEGEETDDSNDLEEKLIAALESGDPDALEKISMKSCASSDDEGETLEEGFEAIPVEESVPTLNEALDAVSVVRRFLRSKKNAKLMLLSQLEEEVWRVGKDDP